MKNFKVGDKVERINRDYGDISVGDIRVISGVYDYGICLIGCVGSYNTNNFKLVIKEVKYKRPPRNHPNDDLYEEWLKGADIQCRNSLGVDSDWCRSSNYPNTYPFNEYRIDPNCIIPEISPRQLEIDKLKLQAQELLSQVDKLQSMDKGE